MLTWFLVQTYQSKPYVTLVYLKLLRTSPWYTKLISSIKPCPQKGNWIFKLGHPSTRKMVQRWYTVNLQRREERRKGKEGSRYLSSTDEGQLRLGGSLYFVFFFFHTPDYPGTMSFTLGVSSLYL